MPKVGYQGLNPFWRTTDSSVCLYQGNARDVLARLPDESVHMCVTSPPYWRQRDYQTGDEYELGREALPTDYIHRLVVILREARRVLRADGTLWLNLGDTYNEGMLEGIPWRVALALTNDEWRLRQDIIWHKPDAMPTSVDSRCTTAHEYVFMFAKSKSYYFDHVAVKEKSVADKFTKGVSSKPGYSGNPRLMGHKKQVGDSGGYANKRDVWTISSGSGYSGAHFATYPPKLIEPCIKAGTSEYGCCGECSAPFRRLTRESQVTRRRPNDYVKRTGEEGTGNACPNSVAGVRVETIGWEPTCKCGGMQDMIRPAAREVRPCVVLDPFVGSGTTCEVALGLGRHSIGIDLSRKYLEENAIPRIEGALLARPRLAALAGHATSAIELGEDCASDAPF